MIFGKIRKAFKEGGFSLVLQRSFNYTHNRVRKYLPKKEFTKSHLPYEGRLGDYHNSKQPVERNDIKWQARQSVFRYVNNNDKCFCIGGGEGITASHMAEKGDHVVIAEPAKQMIEKINSTMSLSNHENYEVKPWLFYSSPEEDIWGNLHSETEQKTGEDIPKCDVLEMDCEGAELPILRDIEVCPRVLIVEVHCKKGIDYNEVIDTVEEKGYHIDFEYIDYYDRNTRHFVAVKN